MSVLGQSAGLAAPECVRFEHAALPEMNMELS